MSRSVFRQRDSNLGQLFTRVVAHGDETDFLKLRRERAALAGCFNRGSIATRRTCSGHIDRSSRKATSPLGALLDVCHHRPVNGYAVKLHPQLVQPVTDVLGVMPAQLTAFLFQQLDAGDTAACSSAITSRGMADDFACVAIVPS